MDNKEHARYVSNLDTLSETVAGAAAASYVGPKNAGLTSTKIIIEKLKNTPPIDEVLKKGSKYTIYDDEEEEKADKEEDRRTGGNGTRAQVFIGTNTRFS